MKGNIIIAESKPPAVQSCLAPLLSVRGGARAIEFYKAAFAAVEVFRLDFPGGVVAQLSLDDSSFWVSDESPQHSNFSPETLGGAAGRLILTVADPDAVFARALSAGASQVYPVGVQHGSRVGRVVDPFGYHWEITGPPGD